MPLFLEMHKRGVSLFGFLGFLLQSTLADEGDRPFLFRSQFLDLLLQCFGDLEGNDLVAFHGKDYTEIMGCDKLIKGNRR